MCWPDEGARIVKNLVKTCAVATCVVLVGCATTPTSSGPAKPAETPKPAPAPETASPAKESAAPAVTERKRNEYPDVETDETGFTVTERIRISGEIRGEYESALQMLAQQRYEQGISALVAITQEAPEVTAPYIDLGIAYAQTGDLERAEAALETASQLSPDHPIVRNELGIVYRKTGQFSKARASYEKALEIYPGFHYAQRNLGVLCDLYLADLDCALEQYEAYLDSVGTDAEVEVWVTDLHNRLAAKGEN